MKPYTKEMQLGARRKKKKFKPERQVLEKEADRLFSLYIRQRNAVNGIVQCFTCGKFFFWRDTDCGHYISRAEIGTRYDTINCQVQCKICNISKKGNIAQFALRLIEKYGSEVLIKLNYLSQGKIKDRKFFYRTIIEKFTEKLIEIGGVLK